MRPWLECVSLHPPVSGTFHDLLDSIYTTGIESLFSVDTLRGDRDSKSELALFDAFEALAEPVLTLLPAVLSQIFSSFVQCLRRCRSALYIHGSNQASNNPEELRVEAMNFFASCHNLLDHLDQSEEVWSARLATLSVVEKENLFVVNHPKTRQSLTHVSDLAAAALDTAWNSTL